MVETKKTSRALWHIAKGRSVLIEESLPALQAGEALVRTLFSGISRGTERLVLAGLVPQSEHENMRCPFQQGRFPFPVKYGYCAVGVVEDGPPEWLGRNVFVLHPHQDRFVVPLAALNPLPEHLPPRRATLAANMETALNAVWDSGAGPGDRIAVVGGGVVGLLVAFLCAGLPGAEVSLADIVPGRAAIAASLGARFVDAAAPGTALAGSDVVFHTSATAAGLELAIASAANEARVVEMSWYGSGPVAAGLGGAFHSRRLHLIASQVGQIAASRRPRWDFARRMAKALDLLGDYRLDALLTADIAFASLPAALPAILAQGAPGLATCVTF